MILAAALMGTTMSFAANARVTVYEAGGKCEYSPSFVVENTTSGANVYGLRIYAYFTSNNGVDPQKDLKMNVNTSYTVTRVFDNVYRIMLSEYNTVIGGRTSKYYKQPFSLKPSSSSRCYQPYTRDTHHNEFVVEDRSGGIQTAAQHPTFNNRVGLLVSEGYNCPGFNKAPNYIYLDAEDSKRSSGILNGNKTPKGVKIDDGKNIFFYYCPVYVSSMRQTSYDYAVLRLDRQCPAGSYPFYRKHDTENSNNANNVHGYFYPNVINSDALLHYCFVPGKGGTSNTYPVDNIYGIFANPSSDITNVERTEFFVDDENTNNKNSWYFYPETEQYKERIFKIMHGSDNTVYNVISAKSASAAKAAPIVASYAEISTPVVAKATLAAVKDVSREAVGVDLQAAGDVEVSLVGVDGHVFAKVSASNLQPGFASLNWNAAAVPAGRYIVSVKHNGSISGKNVVLK